MLILSVGGLVARTAGRSGRTLRRCSASAVSVRGLYTPVLILTVLVLIARCSFSCGRTSSSAHGSWSPAVVRVVVIGVLACAGPLSPVLYGLGERLVDGHASSARRSSGAAARAVSISSGSSRSNPNHPVRALGDTINSLATATVFVEYTAALSLVALGVIASPCGAPATVRARDGSG